MSDDPPTVDEARTTAYEMAFKRFEPLENSASGQWDELPIRQQRRVIADRLSTWKQGVVFRTVVAPALKSMAKQLAKSRGNGESTHQTIVNRFETTLFEAFDADLGGRSSFIQSITDNEELRMPKIFSKVISGPLPLYI